MKRARLEWMAWVVLGATLASCQRGPQLAGQIRGLRDITEQAERNGAVRCAPRELATAQSHLDFAEIELAQGYISKAQHHVFLAEANARSAYTQSPPQYCAERGFIEPARGDRDGDGYLDDQDRCPELPENYNLFEDEDGCPDAPDTDADGVNDGEDSCVILPEDADQYLDDDGCPEADNDLDGLLDAVDKCPLEAEDPEGYQDEDGCPDLDNDGDTVPDLKDQCPNTIGSPDVEPLGCPTNSLVVVTDCEVKITQQIHFEYNKATIRKVSYNVLDAVVEVLDRNPAIKIEVQGHTDNRGAAAYNKQLSDRRAASVRDYLVSHGIDAARITSRGYGFDQPLVPNTSDQNRALNRRVQFVRANAKEGCPKTGSD